MAANNYVWRVGSDTRLVLYCLYPINVLLLLALHGHAIYIYTYLLCACFMFLFFLFFAGVTGRGLTPLTAPPTDRPLGTALRYRRNIARRDQDDRLPLALRGLPVQASEHCRVV